MDAPGLVNVQVLEKVLNVLAEERPLTRIGDVVDAEEVSKPFKHAQILRLSELNLSNCLLSNYLLANFRGLVLGRKEGIPDHPSKTYLKR